MAGPNERALKRALRVLVLTDADVARKELALSLARAVDADPCLDCGAGRNAALWKEYRAALSDLHRVGTPDDADDDQKDWLVRISTPVRAKVGYPEDA
jgi:hypothetical protein